MVIDRDAPDEQIITHPPLLCVEILSREDRMPRFEREDRGILPDGRSSRLDHRCENTDGLSERGPHPAGVEAFGNTDYPRHAYPTRTQRADR